MWHEVKSAASAAAASTSRLSFHANRRRRYVEPSKWRVVLKATGGRRSTESPETLLTLSINSRSETECQAHRSKRRAAMPLRRVGQSSSCRSRGCGRHATLALRRRSKTKTAASARRYTNDAVLTLQRRIEGGIHRVSVKPSRIWGHFEGERVETPFLLLTSCRNARRSHR